MADENEESTLTPAQAYANATPYGRKVYDAAESPSGYDRQWLAGQVQRWEGERGVAPVGPKPPSPALLASAAAFRARQTEKQQRIADTLATLRISEEVEQLQRERENGALRVAGDVVLNAVDIPVQALRGALLGIAEIPQAFADAGVEEDPNEFHLINDPLRAVSKYTKLGINAVLPEPRNAVGGFAEGVGRFLSAFIPISRAVKAGTLGSTLAASPKTAAAVSGAIADFTVFEPAEENLSALLRDHAELTDPVTAFLATDPNDDAALNRLRNAVEGIGFGLATDGLMAGLKVIRGLRKAKELSAEEAAGRAEADTIEIPETTPKVEEPKPAAAADEGAEKPAAEPQSATEPPKPIIETTTVQTEGVAGAVLSPTAQVSTALRASGRTGLVDFNQTTIDWNTFGDNADDVWNVIEVTSNAFADQIDQAKGGVQSLKETARLAELVGGSVENVVTTFNNLRGGHGLAANIRAAEQVMLASADRVRTLARKIKETGDGRAELIRAIEQHAGIQAAVKSSKTEIARALHAMRALKDMAEVDFSRIDDALLDKLAGTKSLKDLNAMARKASGRRWHDYALEVWINGLLSGPVTHAVNNASNTLKVALAVPERLLASAFGNIRRAFGQNNADRVRMGESIAAMHGMVQGLVDAIRLPARTVAQAAREGSRWNLAGAREVLEQNAQEFGTVWRALAEGRPILDGSTKIEGLHVPALKWSTEGTTGARRVGIQVANLLGSAIRAPGSALQAADELYKGIGYRQELHALAFRTAHAEADQLPKAARAAHVAKRAKEILAKPPEELHLRAIDFARQQTFTAPLGTTGRAVQQFLARVPLLRFIVPFVRTPANILKDFVRYSPGIAVKLGQKEFRQQLAKGGAAADIALARLTLGTSAIAAVWMAADAGNLVGGGPSGKDSGELSGVKPYSVKLGDKWYSFQRLEPMGMLFGSVADLHGILERQYDAQGDNIDIAEAFQLIAIAAAKNASSKTWLSGISDFVDAWSDPERYAGSYLSRMGASFVPFSSALRNGTVMADPMAREAFTMLDKMRAGIPGMSDSLPIKRDYLGREVRHNKPWLSPIAVSEASTDPVDVELSRLQFELEMPDRSVDGVPLTAARYSRLLELRGSIGGEGKNLHAALSRLISDPNYSKLSDTVDPSIQQGTKASEIKKIVSLFHSAAVRTLRAEDGEFRQLWEDAYKKRRGAQ